MVPAEAPLMEKVCCSTGCLDVFTGAQAPVRRPDPGRLDRKTGKYWQTGTALMVCGSASSFRVYAVLHHLFNSSETDAVALLPIPRARCSSRTCGGMGSCRRAPKALRDLKLLESTAAELRNLF